MPIRHATGKPHSIPTKVMGERFSYIKVRSECSLLYQAILQALHEFESDHNVTIEEFQFNPSPINSEAQIFIKHSRLNHPHVRFPVSY